MKNSIKRLVWVLVATAGLIAVTAAPAAAGTSFNHSEPFLGA
ncbi:hypothetical protein OHA72_60870 [Dactylosporangium sp. NBC_01737]|nr:hypothetical protein OHA72_60870 [Dactylosporangium sp. NBC_01737]